MTCAIVNTFEIDWIDTSVFTSPAVIDLAVGGDQRDAEQVRIDLGERGNVVGVLAFLQVLVLLVRRVDRCLRIARLRDCARRERRRRPRATSTGSHALASRILRS